MTLVVDRPAPPEAVFQRERARLVGLAYRVLGSWAEAEDVAQDTWLRWDALGGAGREGIANPAAWLTTVTSRLALDHLRSARRRRESYVGPWLSEPSVRPVAGPDGPADPQDHAELAESLTLGFLAVLESLQPVERVVFVLADVYAVPFAEIATAVGSNPAACRQAASRARRKVRAASRPGLDPPPEARRIVAALVGAVTRGDVDAVTALLAPDVVLVSDGGPTRHAARRPVVGTHRVGRFLVNLARRVIELELDPQPAEVNGQAGLVFRRADGRPELVVEVETVDGRAWRIHAVSAPDKLLGV